MPRIRLSRLGPAASILLLCACGTRNPAGDAATDASDGSTDVTAYSGAAAVHVSLYDYAIDLSTREVTSRLSLQLTTAGDCISLPFRPSEARTVTFDGVSARDVVADGTYLSACDGSRRGWPAGATVILSASLTEPLTTWRPLQVGYSVRPDALGHDSTYLLSWVGECDRHGPCDNDPSVFASFHFTVTHPSGTRVFCPGHVTPGDTRTTCEFDYTGGPTYSTFGFLAGQSWHETPLGQWSNVNVTLWDTTASGIEAALNRTALADFMTWLTARLGPYPYGDELRLIVAPTYWAGFEHPGNISLADTLASGRVMHTVMHEIVHQWAGDQTTLASVSDFAWKEAMAEYLTFVFEDEHMTPEEARATTQTWKDSSLHASTFPVPTEPRTLLQFYGAAYGPGSMVLFRQIEAMFGRARVLQAIASLLGHPHAISMEDVRMALETATGADLSAYFAAWVRGTGVPSWPTAQIVRTPTTDGGWSVSVTMNNADGIARGCRFVVQLRGASGETLDVPIDLGVNGVVPPPAIVHPTFAVVSDVLDPYNEALVYPAPTGGRTAMNPWTSPVEPWLAPRR